jgi:hypothetical protein
MKTLLFGAVILAICVPSATAAEPITVPIDGAPFAAELTAVDGNWQFTFRAGKDERKLAAGELMAWGDLVEPKSRSRLPEFFPPAELILADGGVLVVDIKNSQSEALIAESSALGELKIPFETVRGILFRPPINRQRRDALANRLTEDAAKTDRLILENGDVVTGRIVRFTSMPGTENKPAQFSIEIESAAAPASINAERVAAVAFNPESLDPPLRKGQRALVGLRDGSRLLVESLKANDKEVELRLPGGATWKAERDQLGYVQPFTDNNVYVSDLIVPQALDDSGDKAGTFVGKPPREKAARYKFVPFLTAPWPLRADANVRGAHLRADGKLYVKGLGMHSGGMLTLALPGKFRRFDAEAALDDGVGPRGSVVFAVKVYGMKDGKTAVLREFTSEVIRGGRPPVPASVDLTDAAGLSLSVLYSERGDELDHANWLNARLVR